MTLDRCPCIDPSQNSFDGGLTLAELSKAGPLGELVDKARAWRDTFPDAAQIAPGSPVGELLAAVDRFDAYFQGSNEDAHLEFEDWLLRPRE